MKERGVASAEQTALAAAKPPITPDEAIDLVAKIFASSQELDLADERRRAAHEKARLADRAYEKAIEEHRKISAPSVMPLFDDKAAATKNGHSPKSPPDPAVSAAAAVLRKARRKS